MHKAPTTHVPSYSLFAQLLASERLRVTIDKMATTASFAPEHRILTLPSWSGFGEESWLLFIAHEVGHALFTPAAAFSHPTVTRLSQQYGTEATRTVLNIFEDIRIERLVREKFRGLTGVFNRGYHALLGRKFFGFTSEELTPEAWCSRTLLDRLNIYGKVGGLLRVSLDDAQEIAWYNDALRTETFDDVLALVERVMAQLEAQRQSQSQPQPSQAPQTGTETQSAASDPSAPPSQAPAPSAPQTSEDSPSTSQDGAQADAQADASEEATDDAPTSAQGQDDTTDPSTNAPASQADPSETGPETPSSGAPTQNPFAVASQQEADAQLQSAARVQRYASDAAVHMLPSSTDYLHVNDVSLAELLRVWGATEAQRSALRELVMQQRREQSSILASMIAAFRANQSAWQSRRAQVSKSGSIDPTKLAQYKLVDDLFLRRRSLPEAQNHGFVLHIDWSGSMEHKMTTVLWQVLHLLWFAESIKVPIRVYGFSNGGSSTPEALETPRGPMMERGRLLTLYDSTATPAMKQDAQAFLFALVLRFANFFTYGHGVMTQETGNHSRLPKSLVPAATSLVSQFTQYTYDEMTKLFYHRYVGMAGTPLYHALLSSIDTVRAFRTKHRIEQCISVWLTDGDDTDGVPIDPGTAEGQIAYRQSHAYFNHPGSQRPSSTLIDPRSGRTFSVTEGRGLSAMFALHRALTGATVICIDITDMPVQSFRRVLSKAALEVVVNDVGITADQFTRRGRIRGKVQKQTRKRVIVKSQSGTFTETGLLLLTNRQYPEIGADAYLVTHPEWWVSSDAYNTQVTRTVVSRTSHLWDDDDDVKNCAQAYAQAVEARQTTVKLSEALLHTTGVIAMRRFADLLVPYMAAGREDATV